MSKDKEDDGSIRVEHLQLVQQLMGMTAQEIGKLLGIDMDKLAADAKAERDSPEDEAKRLATALFYSTLVTMLASMCFIAGGFCQTHMDKGDDDGLAQEIRRKFLEMADAAYKPAAMMAQALNDKARGIIATARKEHLIEDDFF